MNPELLCTNCMEEAGENAVCPHCGRPTVQPPDSPLHLPPRTILHEQYVIGRVLGHGGFGVTYLGWDMNLARKVAVKEYLPHGVATRTGGAVTVIPFSGQNQRDYEWGLEKFLEEARVVARFSNHPGIVSVVNFFRANGSAYLVMEFLDGDTFQQYLARKGGRIAFNWAVRIMTPVMDALCEVHRIGLLHRDVSPDNVFLTRNGQVKVLDFGAARYALGQQSRNLSIILKEGFAPEEQYRTKGNQGPWTDVYAVAATIYQAITGVVPPPALDRLDVDELLLPSALGAEVPAAGEATLMKGLAVRAANRYQSMEDFRTEIVGNSAPVSGGVAAAALDIGKERLISSTHASAPTVTMPLTAPEPGPPPLPPPPPPPRAALSRKWLAAAAALILLVGGLLAYSAARMFRTPASPASAAPSTTPAPVTASQSVPARVTPPASPPAAAPDRTPTLGTSPNKKPAHQPEHRREYARREAVHDSGPASASQSGGSTQEVAQTAVETFRAEPETIQKGGSATLIWAARDAKYVVISPLGRFDPQGQAQVSPAGDTTYTLTAFGAGGQTASSSIGVKVNAGSSYGTPAAPGPSAYGQQQYPGVQRPPPVFAIFVTHVHTAAGPTHAVTSVLGAIDRRRSSRDGDSCSGMLRVAGGYIAYRASDPAHRFRVPVSEIADVSENAVLLRGTSAFHIRFDNGSRYNFIPQNGAAVAAVEAIRRAMR